VRCFELGIAATAPNGRTNRQGALTRCLLSAVVWDSRLTAQSDPRDSRLGVVC